MPFRKLALLVVLSTMALSPAGQQLPSGEANVVRATLDNGLRVVIIRDPLAPVASLYQNYLVGANETPPGFPGMAHAQEHMIFRGCEGVTADQASAIFAELGGVGNANTQQNITQYYATVPAADLEVALRLDAACMKNAEDSQAEWEKERGAIEQEVARDLSEPTYKFLTRLNEDMFLGTPYAHDALGTRESFEKTTGAALKQCYNDWYVPNNAILVIAGDVDSSAVLAKVRELYGGIPRKTLPPRPEVRLNAVKSETFKRVTLADVNRVAKEYLVDRSSITATLIPSPSGEAVTSKGFGGGEQLTSAPTKPVELPSWAASALSTLRVPELRTTWTDTTLPNQIRLIVKTERTSPTITVLGNVRHDARLQVPPGKEGVEDVIGDLFSYGTTTLDRLVFQKALDDIAASERAGFDFSVRVLKGDFSRGAELLADNELHPALPSDAFAIVRRQTADYVEGNVYNVDNEFTATKSRGIYTVTYGADPENVSKARDLIVRDLRDMQKENVTPAELHQAKALVLRQIALSESSEDAVAGGLLSRAQRELPLDEAVRAGKRYFALSADEVRAAFTKWIRPEGFVQVVRGPAPK